MLRLAAILKTLNFGAKSLHGCSHLEGKEGPSHHLAVFRLPAGIQKYGLVTIDVLVLVPESTKR